MENIENMTIDSKTPPTELNILTFKSITKDGVEYKVHYDSNDGIKIPCTITGYNCAPEVYYLAVGKDVLKSMMTDLLPEVLCEINNRTATSTNIKN